MCTPKGEKCRPTQCCVDLGPDCAPLSAVPDGVSAAWELGDGGCAGTLSASSQCAETRMPDTENADDCKRLVVEANVDFANGRTPTLHPSTNLRYPSPNTWPPTVFGQQMSIGTANGVSWGRGSPPDPDRIRLSLVDNDINHGSYKQCWAEFG